MEREGVTFQFQIEKLLKARKLNAGGWSKLERKENALVSLGKLASIRRGSSA
jgi:hypothetical protein